MPRRVILSDSDDSDDDPGGAGQCSLGTAEEVEVVAERTLAQRNAEGFANAIDLDADEAATDQNRSCKRVRFEGQHHSMQAPGSVEPHTMSSDAPCRLTGRRWPSSPVCGAKVRSHREAAVPADSATSPEAQTRFMTALVEAATEARAAPAPAAVAAPAVATVATATTIPDAQRSSDLLRQNYRIQKKAKSSPPTMPRHPGIGMVHMGAVDCPPRPAFNSSNSSTPGTSSLDSMPDMLFHATQATLESLGRRSDAPKVTGMLLDAWGVQAWGSMKALHKLVCDSERRNREVGKCLAVLDACREAGSLNS